MTRWHEDDLAGRILNSPDGKNWKVINIPAICTVEDDGEYHSGRQVGDALWPEKHPLEQLNGEREKDPNGFNCLYQGDPASAEGAFVPRVQDLRRPQGIRHLRPLRLLYRRGRRAPTTPPPSAYDIYRGPNADMERADQADGAAAVRLGEGLRDQRRQHRHHPHHRPGMVNRQSPPCSTCGAKATAAATSSGRDISKKMRAHVSLFHQGANKESRIITNAARVNEQIVMPFDWERRFPQLYQKATHYLAVFKANAHDDVPDVLTGIYEKELSLASDTPYGKRRGVRRR